MCVKNRNSYPFTESQYGGDQNKTETRKLLLKNWKSNSNKANNTLQPLKSLSDTPMNTITNYY